MNINENGLSLNTQEILEIYRNKRLSRVALAKKYGIKARDVGRIINGKLFSSVTDKNGRTAIKIKHGRVRIIKDYIAETEREIRDNKYQLSLYVNKSFMLDNQMEILKLELQKINRS